MFFNLNNNVEYKNDLNLRSLIIDFSHSSDTYAILSILICAIISRSKSLFLGSRPMIL